MLPRALLLPVLAGLVHSQTTTSSSYSIIATPDALPVTDLRDFDIPTYTEVPGLDSDIILYATATAVAAAAADQSASPLSVFPAATGVAINAAGEGDDGENDNTSNSNATSGQSKRDIERRSACAPQPTVANYYNVNLANASAFKADPTIASVALNAPTPSGYFNTVKNAPGSNNAYGYLGYSIVNQGKTGYDVQWCASKCSAISGCLSFNIYFERDPTLSPGSGCDNPPAFAMIKCSFWGTALDSSTANGGGQIRDQFEVAVAGSNAYNSYKVGGPITGWSPATALNNSAINAPGYDCSNTLTYLGFKLFQSGPFDPQLCSAACNAQTAYNLAHPPASGNAVQCAAFGTYLLTMTNKTGSYQLGQMCTMYTSVWSASYATNTVAYDDAIGAKYTYSYSFFYSRPDIQPICQSDINSLISSGSDFCTSFNSYSAPTTTVSTTSTPPVVGNTLTYTFSTSTIIASGTPTTSITANVQWKRDGATASVILNDTTTYTTVSSVPPSSAVVLGSYIATVTIANGTVPTGAPDNVVAAPAKRQASSIPTPANVASWPSSRISAACSSVATGTSTVTATTTLPTLFSTSTVSVVAATTLQACIVPSELPDYTTFTPIWGRWSGDTLQDLGYGITQQQVAIQLPFNVNLGTVSSNVVTVGTNGYVFFGNGNQAELVAFANQGEVLYIYWNSNGVFYRITGEEGSRQLVIAWYVGTLRYGHMQEHFTMTYFEDTHNWQFKYMDIVQTGDYEAFAYVKINNQYTNIVTAGNPFYADGQYQISTSGDTASVVYSTHNRVDCCTKRPDNWFGGWHSCTEFQPALDQ